MESLVKRIGYFLRDTSEGKPSSPNNKYIVRYFVVDNHSNLYYTISYASLQHLISRSKNYAQLFENAAREFKSIQMAEISTGKLKKFERPEFMPFLNEKYFDVEIELQDPNLETSTVGKPKDSKSKKNLFKLMFFTFKDQHIELMLDFMSSYEETISKTENNSEDEPIFKIEQNQNDEEEVDIKGVEQKGEDLQDLKEKLEKLVGIIQEVENQENKIKSKVSEENEELQIRYSGPKENDLPEGKGKQFFEGGITYSGQFKAGKRHGKGFFLDTEQNMCYVECVNGKVAGL